MSIIYSEGLCHVSATGYAFVGDYAISVKPTLPALYSRTIYLYGTRNVGSVNNKYITEINIDHHGIAECRILGTIP